MKTLWILLCIPLLLLVEARDTPSAAQVPGEIAVSDSLTEARLADGTVVVGRVAEVTGDLIVLVTPGGARVEVQRAQLVSLRAVGGEAGDPDAVVDSNRTRLLFGPTARSLRAGEGYLGLFELFFSFVSVGVTDWVTLAGGTPILPGAMGEVFYLAPKVRLPAAGGLDLAAGVLAFFATEELDEGSVGIAYGVGTWGTPEAALTVGAGWPFALTDSGSEISGQPLVMLGGERQLGRRSKFITENYFAPGENGVLASGGVRLFGERFSGDVGVGAWLGDGAFCCLPLLNVVYTFGGR